MGGTLDVGGTSPASARSHSVCGTCVWCMVCGGAEWRGCHWSLRRWLQAPSRIARSSFDTHRYIFLCPPLSISSFNPVIIPTRAHTCTVSLDTREDTSEGVRVGANKRSDPHKRRLSQSIGIPRHTRMSHVHTHTHMSHAYMPRCVGYAIAIYAT